MGFALLVDQVEITGTFLGQGSTAREGGGQYQTDSFQGSHGGLLSSSPDRDRRSNR